MSANMNKDQTTKVFQVIATDSTEEYILGDAVESAISELDLKYDTEQLENQQLENVQVKYKMEPEDIDSKKNVIQDLVKLVKSEPSENVLEPFTILKDEPPWDDDYLERKLDQFTNDLKNKERKLKGHKTTDAIPRPQVNKEQPCKMPLKSLEIIEIDESSSDNGQEENCISEHMENKSNRTEDIQHKSTNLENPSNVKYQYRQTTILHCWEMKNKRKFDNTLLLLRDEENSLSKSGIEDHNKSSQVPPTEREIQNTTEAKNQLIQSMVATPQEQRKTVIVENVNLCNSQVVVDNKSSVSLDSFIYKISHNNLPKQTYSNSLGSKNYSDLIKDSVNSITKESLKCSRDNNKRNHTDVVTKEMKTDKDYRSVNDSSLKDILSSTLPKKRNTIKPNLSFQPTLQPVEVIEILDDNLEEVWPVKKDEPGTHLNNCTLQNSGKKCIKPIQISEHEISTKITRYSEKDLNSCHNLSDRRNEKCIESGQINLTPKQISKVEALENYSSLNEVSENNMASSVKLSLNSCKKQIRSESIIGKNVTVNDMSIYNKDSMSSEFRKNFNFPQGQNESDKLSSNQATQLEKISEVLENFDDVTMPSKFRKEPKFICKLCNKYFSRPSRLKRHLDTHSGFKNYACVTCCKAYTSRSALKYHNQNVHSTACHKCDKCGKEYRSSLALKKHFNRYHSESAMLIRGYKCELCQKTFKDKGRLNEHKLVKHSVVYDRDLNFICHHCSSKFLNKELLKSHIFKLHMPPMFKCEKCLESFTSKTNLVSHFRRAHLIDNRKSYICETCGKVMKSHTFKTHLLTHTGDLPFVCQECGKRFRTVSNLDQHLRTHSDVRPYTCDMCDKAFRIRHHLRQHLAVHGMVSTARYGKRAITIISSSESNSTDDELSSMEES